MTASLAILVSAIGTGVSLLSSLIVAVAATIAIASVGEAVVGGLLLSTRISIGVFWVSIILICGRLIPVMRKDNGFDLIETEVISSRILNFHNLVSSLTMSKCVVVVVFSGCEKEAALDLHGLLLVHLRYERSIEKFLPPDRPCRILLNVLTGR